MGPLYRFSGSAGEAIVSKTAAYLVTDSRYWLQAEEQIDSNWRLIPAGSVDGPKDWIEWIVVSTPAPQFLLTNLNHTPTIGPSEGLTDRY
jgi:hypothetical protein